MYKSQLSYVGSNGEVFQLDGRLSWVGTALGVRGRSWDYTLARRGILNQSRVAREATLDIHYTTLSQADALRRIADKDVSAGTPGRLVSITGYEQRAYIVAQDPDTRFHDKLTASLTVLLLDGVWRKLVTTSYGKEDESSDYGKKYTYGYLYDYAPPENARTVEVDAPAPVPIRLMIYGYANNPSITIGGNEYAFDVEIPTGGYLLVDTRPDPTVTLVNSAGVSSDAFSSAHRGAGLNSGEYAFQPVSPGVQTVGWDNSFGFDLGVYLEESEIPWIS